jgi:hypothetical protein
MILKTFIKGTQRDRGVPILSISKVMSYEDYIHYANEPRQTIIADLSFEKNFIPDTCTEFTYNGYCYVCGTYVDFLVDFEHSNKGDGVLMPNWRESLFCPICHLNNRMRAAVHILDQEYHPNRRSNIYITEQTTALYKSFKQKFPRVVGSEYFGDSVNYGSYNNKKIRNEDLTHMSFNNNQFDYILSFDVFEHIPNYKKALAECCRCLKPGGVLFFSVPFVRTSKKNIVLAYLSQAGEIIHLLPPEYHYDPINPDGCLCFYHFGWEMLDDLKIVGFKDSKALLYWSIDLGYLGGEQLMFAATKMTLD